MPVGDIFQRLLALSHQGRRCLQPVGDIFQRLLALSHQGRRCFGSLKRLQSRLAIRANTNLFLWPILGFSLINAGQYRIYLGLYDCDMFT
jgi:hypothetical protein